MATQTERSDRNNNNRGYPDFTPIDCDVNVIEPDAAEGTYNGIIDDARIQATSKDRLPMLVVDWKLDSTETDTEEAEKSLGATISDFFPFFPDGDRRGNFSKRRFRQLRELLDLPDDLVPTRLERKSDFDDLIAELKGKELKLYITLKTNPDTNEERPQIRYTPPRGSMGALPSDDEQQDEDDRHERRPAPRTAKPAPRRPAAKQQARRR